MKGTFSTSSDCYINIHWNSSKWNVRKYIFKERDKTSLSVDGSLNPDLPISMKNSEVYHKYKAIFKD